MIIDPHIERIQEVHRKINGVINNQFRAWTPNTKHDKIVDKAMIQALDASHNQKKLRKTFSKFIQEKYIKADDND